jgi:hypothetical protein
MKFRYALPVLIALVLVVAACVPPPNLRNEKFLNDDSLLTNEPCAAPCWNNITPGETTWDNALITIQDDPRFDEPQTQTAQDDSKAVGALWKETGGDDCCQMVSEDGDTVSLILLQLAPNHTLGELIEARGEPAYAVGTPGNEDQAIVNLFYPDDSLIVIVFVAGAANGQLSESSEVIGAYYLTPDRMQLILDTSSLYGWKGYEPFSAYAPDAENADYAITPSVTLTPTPGE